jgi:phosphate transport system substrate-binding protein
VQVKTSRRLAWLALPLSLALVAGACGSDDDDATGDEGETPEEDFSGETINISGSSTVAPITEIVAEDFDESTGSSTTVDDPGTGDGFAEFCQGNTDISDASRTIKEEEAAECQTAGIEYVELKVGFDGMAVMTSPNNDQVECLSFADLYALTGPESDGFSNWSDAQAIATELGSTTELPDADLELTGPGTESGTYDSFIEIVTAGIAEERAIPEDKWETLRTDYASSGDDNVIVDNIKASDTSLGWVGWAYAQEQGEDVKNIPISADADGDCVEVSNETIASGDYPLSRSLYIYVNKAKAAESEALVAFVDFYLDNLTTYVEEAGYVALPDDQQQESVDAWAAR